MTTSERKKPGRPPLPIEKQKVVVGIRLPRGEAEQLQQVAAARGITPSELIRETVLEWLKQGGPTDAE